MSLGATSNVSRPATRRHSATPMVRSESVKAPERTGRPVAAKPGAKRTARSRSRSAKITHPGSGATDSRGGQADANRMGLDEAVKIAQDMKKHHELLTNNWRARPVLSSMAATGHLISDLNK